MDWLDWSAMGHDPGGPLRCLKKPVKTAEVVFLTVYVVISFWFQQFQSIKRMVPVIMCIYCVLVKQANGRKKTTFNITSAVKKQQTASSEVMTLLWFSCLLFLFVFFLFCHCRCQTYLYSADVLSARWTKTLSTRRALGRVHVPPTKINWWLSD